MSWVEYYGVSVTNLRDAVWAVRKARTVGAKSAFAIGNVAKIKETCLSVANAKVRVVPEPLDHWPAHAGIRRLPRDDLNLLAALADEAFSKMLPNKDIPAEP
ncbi:MAG: hypothetical protein ACREFZ_09450 [Acetobacteraceae bacterium]